MNTRRILILVMVFVFAFSLVTPVQACGNITHHYIAEQALNVINGDGYNNLYEILKNHPGELNYGAVFPDWGFYTGERDQAYYVSTDQFMVDYMNYLLPHLNRPFSDEEQKEIAFLFGVIAHNTADKYFHSLGSDFNFLNAAQSSDYGNLSMEEFLLEEEVDLFVRDIYEGYFTNNSCDGWNIPDWNKQALHAAFEAHNSAWNITAFDPLGLQVGACNWEKIEPRNTREWIDQNFFNYPNISQPLPLDENGVPKEGHGGLLDLYTNHVPAAWEQAWNWLNPATQISVTPTQPDGSNGWYRQPVKVTFTAAAILSGQLSTQYSLDGGGTYQQYNGPFTISTDGEYNISYYSVYTAEPTQNIETIKSATIKIDMTPPTISGAATTLPNANGWYNASVTVHFTAEDALSGLASLTADQTLTNEGAGQSVTGVAVDLAGNSASFTVEPINIDLTPPVVDVWVDQPSYTRVEPFIVHYTGTDAVSDIASLTAEFNGQPVVNGQTIDLFWLPLGTYSLAVHAEDLAGNVTNVSQSIELMATIESLQGTVNRLCRETNIAKSGTCKELSAKLDAALASRDRGNRIATVQVLKAFQNAVRAQTGKGISERGALLLLADSDYVITNLSY